MSGKKGMGRLVAGALAVILLFAGTPASSAKAFSQNALIMDDGKDREAAQEGAGQAMSQESGKDGASQESGKDGAVAKTSQESGQDSVSQGSGKGSTGGETAVGASLVVDNRNVYEGMDRPYCEGYAPQIANHRTQVVVPILFEGPEGTALRDDTLRVSLNLGDGASSPFVYKNYNRSITRQSHSVNGGAGTAECFLASFWLEMLPERINGCYPVTLTAEGRTTDGSILTQDFVVYLTVRDGKDPNASEPEPEPEPEEPPVFAPKLLVQSCRFSKEDILAGDEVTAEIILQNTSKSEIIKNLAVTVAAPKEHLTLLSPSDSVYLESVGVGETCTVRFTYRVNVAAPQGQYELTLSMDYADQKGNASTASGKVQMSVRQPTELKFGSVSLPERMEVGDVAQLQIQVMNLGRSKAYHVRAECVADGLTPQGMLFIGDLEAGAMAVGSVPVSVGALTKGVHAYGETQGTLTFYYEDEAGNEQTLQETFSAEIASPFSGEAPEPEDEPGQWWVVMAVILALLCCCGVAVLVRKVRAARARAQRGGDG